MIEAGERGGSYSAFICDPGMTMWAMAGITTISSVTAREAW
jgi:hypothetical protein